MHLSHFVKQKPKEHIEYILRRHWLTFIPSIGFFLILLAIPPAFYLLINNLFPEVLHSEIIYPLCILIGSVYYLFTYMFFYIRFIDYYLDLWIITNDRIIDIEQKGLFDRTITELELFRIQDVTTNVTGIFGTIFHYGNLTVTTASNTNSIIFHHIPHPDVIRQELIRLADADRPNYMDNVDPKTE